MKMQLQTEPRQITRRTKKAEKHAPEPLPPLEDAMAAEQGLREKGEKQYPIISQPNPQRMIAKHLIKKASQANHEPRRTLYLNGQDHDVTIYRAENTGRKAVSGIGTERYVLRGIELDLQKAVLAEGEKKMSGRKKTGLDCRFDDLLRSLHLENAIEHQNGYRKSIIAQYAGFSKEAQEMFSRGYDVPSELGFRPPVKIGLSDDSIQVEFPPCYHGKIKSDGVRYIQAAGILAGLAQHLMKDNE